MGISSLSNEVSFTADSYAPTDLFTDSANIPYIDENDFQARLERVKGQIRSVLIAQENLTLIKELHKAEGIGIDVNNQRAKNAIKLETGRGLALQLQQEETKTSIEQAKLAELTTDLSGYQSQASLKGETWQLKLEGLRIDIDKAKVLLERKREELNAMQNIGMLAG